MWKDSGTLLDFFYLSVDIGEMVFESVMLEYWPFERALALTSRMFFLATLGTRAGLGPNEEASLLVEGSTMWRCEF